MLKESNPIEQEIENSLDAREKLNIAIDDLNKKRTDAESECARSFATDLRTKPNTADLAVAKLNEWKANDKRIAERIEALEQMNQKITDQIEGFKDKYKDNIVAVFKQRIDKLKVQRHEQTSGADTLDRHINELEAELLKLSGGNGRKKKEQTLTQETQQPSESKA